MNVYVNLFRSFVHKLNFHFQCLGLNGIAPTSSSLYNIFLFFCIIAVISNAPYFSVVFVSEDNFFLSFLKLVTQSVSLSILDSRMKPKKMFFVFILNNFFSALAKRKEIKETLNKLFIRFFFFAFVFPTNCTRS